MSEFDPRSELFELVRAFRIRLEWLGRAGAFSVPAGPSPRGQRSDDAQFTAVAEQSQGRFEPTDPQTTPAESPGATTDRQPGMFSAALARALGDTPAGSESSPATMPSPPAGPTSRTALAQIRADLGDCQRCKLSRTRENIVFGIGDPNAALMFVGEAPGRQEDRSGVPFVGPAGQLLDRMIAAMGWSRETVYIANVLKCRPPNNRDPEPDEIASCRPFLAQQIGSVKPRMIVTLGRPAAHLLLDTRAPMHALRGRFHSYEGIKVMPTFHPAYLLRNPEHKRKTWNDLQQVMAEFERLAISPPGRPR